MKFLFNKSSVSIAVITAAVIGTGILLSCRKTALTADNAGNTAKTATALARNAAATPDNGTISPIDPTPGGDTTPAPPPPNYQITKKCSVKCVAGSCNIEVTYDIRTMNCSPNCKCGGALGLYPDCKDNCTVITPTPTPIPTPTPADANKAVKAGQEPPVMAPVYRREVTADAAQLKAQLEIIASCQQSADARMQRAATHLRSIYNLFTQNNGVLRDANAALYIGYADMAKKEIGVIE